jgi:hypothetical protein
MKKARQKSKGKSQKSKVHRFTDGALLADAVNRTLIPRLRRLLADKHFCLLTFDFCLLTCLWGAF